MASKQKRLRTARKKRRVATATLDRLEAGELDLVTLLRKRPASIAPVRIYTLIHRAPHMGEKGTKECLVKAKVYALTRVGDLLDSDVDRIIRHLPARARRDMM